MAAADVRVTGRYRVTGKLAAVMDVHGDQVAYNGHLLYTFAHDHAGQVTGQGVQAFFVATPGLTSLAGSSTAGSRPRRAPPRPLRPVAVTATEATMAPVRWLRSLRAGPADRARTRTDLGQLDMKRKGQVRACGRGGGRRAARGSRR